MNGRPPAMMRHGKVALAVVAVALAAILAWGAPVWATGTVYSFRLVQTNTALATVFDEHHHPGDWIRVTGSGTFDPVANWVQAEGSFTHYNADGSVHMRGTWVATGITSFTLYGGPKPNRLGGVLWLTVAHFHQDGTPCDCMGTGGVPMSVTSAAYAPSGTVTGTTMGPFQQPTGGRVRFSVVDDWTSPRPRHRLLAVRYSDRSCAVSTICPETELFTPQAEVATVTARNPVGCGKTAARDQ